MTLLVGFDSAWTPGNSGSIAGLVAQGADFREIAPPQVVNYVEAEQLILDWQRHFQPKRTIILLDQPTIVNNATGSRPVDKIVCPSVSLRLGGMQPASHSRVEMFGPAAPVWTFLRCFGGAADPLNLATGTHVMETYPVLTLIALKWLQPGRGMAGILPKYNPQRTKTFSLSDWRFVCERTAAFFQSNSTAEVAQWLSEAAQKLNPKKSDQDGLDACLCLLVAMWMHQNRECLMIGNVETGYIVVPYDLALQTELESRCTKMSYTPKDWLKVFRLFTSSNRAENAPPHPSTSELKTISPPRANPQASALAGKGAWRLPEIAELLNRHHQRATYGAVAGILRRLPRGLMQGRAKAPEYSWIVAASGPNKGTPTGYTEQEIHPECLRQIREKRTGVIADCEELLEWLHRSD